MAKELKLTERDLIRGKIYADTLFATRFMFKRRFNKKFVVGDHHKAIGDALDKVYRGEIKRLLINLPPRYSKTEEAVKTFMAKGLAINPRSKFIHLSYSSELALDNSSETRDIVSSDWFRELFPEVRIAQGNHAKHKWYTTEGGGVYAASAAGQVTGFGAGEVEEETDLELEAELDALDNSAEFAGAIIIDDPIKPDDASSATVREKVNNRFDTTIRSRTNSRNTPIIIIMQRLHLKDLCGYLEEIEPGEWTVLSLPAISMDENGAEKALWPFKHTVEELHKLRKANRFVFDSQYQQQPKTLSEKLWCFAFDADKHVGRVPYNPAHPLYMAWDFNRNPLACLLFQHYGGRIRCVEVISEENATTAGVCQIIHRKYPTAFFFVTGDASGKGLTTLNLLHNYGVIKAYFNLSAGQMQYSGANPRLEDSRYFVNSVFEQYPVEIDKENCKPLIFDLENVLADADNKPVKDSRSKKDQQADCLDALRYYFHRYFKDFANFI